jgi:uncharacterized repeat protein (TIGR03803 family)
MYKALPRDLMYTVAHALRVGLAALPFLATSPQGGQRGALHVTTREFAPVRAAFEALLFATFLAYPLVAVAQNEWVVHSFVYNVSGGAYPMGNLVADSAGNLYGTAPVSKGTEENSGWGTVYELVRPISPNRAWTEAVLYSFTGGVDGGEPTGGVIFDAAGNLYGTTSHRGAFGDGTVFELSPPAAAGGAWTESTLHSFQSANGDGANPSGELVWDKGGNLYGVTTFGGADECSCGTVFQLSPPAAPGGAWTETVLYSFNFEVGYLGPIGGPILDANGNLYGTTYGFSYGPEYGVVYRLSRPAVEGAAWAYRTLHNFKSGPDGANPNGALVLRGAGILYGTASRAGLYNSGTVFQLVPPTVAGGDAWTENIIYSFTFAGAGNSLGCGAEPPADPPATNDGCGPNGKLIFDSAGNIYGTTSGGGDDRVGTVFKLAPPASSSGWTETVLHSFEGQDGETPFGDLIFDKNGVLFGVARGGADGVGVVFGVVK